MSQVDEYSTDWSNIDLTNAHQRNLPILDGYTFEQLLLEIETGMPEITKGAIVKHFLLELRVKTETATEVFLNNLNNITKEAKKERKKP